MWSMLASLRGIQYDKLDSLSKENIFILGSLLSSRVNSCLLSSLDPSSCFHIYLHLQKPRPRLNSMPPPYHPNFQFMQPITILYIKGTNLTLKKFHPVLCSDWKCCANIQKYLGFIPPAPSRVMCVCGCCLYLTLQYVNWDVKRAWTDNFIRSLLYPFYTWNVLLFIFNDI